MLTPQEVEMIGMFRQLGPAAHEATLEALRSTLDREGGVRGGASRPAAKPASRSVRTSTALMPAEDSPARLTVGEGVLYFASDDVYGQAARIVGGYSLYLTREGTQRVYRYGYVIELKDSQEPSFVPPCRLTRGDCEPAHLQLVWRASA